MKYVVLENVSGILAVYRVRNDGKLKGLRRWPAQLETSPMIDDRTHAEGA